jgi:hypothetical protein
LFTALSLMTTTERGDVDDQDDNDDHK